MPEAGSDRAAAERRPQQAGKPRLKSSMRNGNRFKLGLFSANCSGGLAITKVPERWSASWEDNLRLIRIADEAGIEFMLPIARWLGYGGETDFQGTSLETISWACGLLANSRSITVFGTVHAPLIHPIFAAKQMATIDHIGSGRFGLNIVCGWNADEFAMFGIGQRAHDDRYEYGEEWWQVVQRIWSAAEPFDHSGKYLTLRNVVGEPKPFDGTRPIVMNAGASPAGHRFAARNCDFLFTTTVAPESAAATVRTTKEQALKYGRSLDVFTTSYVVCRPTQKEAEDYHHYYADEMADWPAVKNLMDGMGLNTHTFPPGHFEKFRTRCAGGHGCYPLIGTPDHIAGELKKLSDAGFGGTTIAFVTYADELPYFVQEVLPRLEAMGLRHPAETRQDLRAG